MSSVLLDNIGYHVTLTAGNAGELFMLVRMTLARIVIVDSEDEKMSMLVLREVDGDRAFPILIGNHEASRTS